MRVFILCILFTALSSASKPSPPKSTTKSFSFVPAGWVVVSGDTLSVQSYYIKKYEVSNAEYREYLNFLEKKGDTSLLKLSSLQNENWLTEPSLSLLSEHYFSNPVFDNYPVVNISYQAAIGYCEYLSSKINNAKLSSAGIKIRVRLPFHAEIIRAGVGDALFQKYPWTQAGLKDSKGKPFANYKESSNNSVVKLKDGTILPEPLKSVKSFNPSQFQVYNLLGNAAEMTNIPGVAVGGSYNDAQDNIQLQHKANYEISSKTVGFRVVFTWVQE